MVKEKSKTVRYLLERYEKAKDDDNFLIAHFWHQEQQLLGLDISKTLRHLAVGKLSTSESITRCRRKLQEEHSELRGNKWGQRHSNANKVIEEIQNWEEN